MATIEMRRNADGSTSFRVKIRLKGTCETQTFDRKTDAKIWAAKRETEIREGRAFGASRKTVAHAIDRYLEEELPRLALGEQKSRRLRLAWWRERCGPTLLSTVSRPMVQEEIRSLRVAGPKGRPVTFATGNRYKAALGAVLSCAVEDWGWLAFHPLRGGGRRKRPKGEREVERERELTPEEWNRLLEACAASKDPRLLPLVLAARYSGGRQGELMGIERAHLRLNPPDGVACAEVFDTKSGHQMGYHRVLYFPGPAGDALRAIPSRLSRYLFAGSDDHPNERPVFPEKAFRTAKARARISDFRFHDLRHMWAATYVEEGGTLLQLTIAGGWDSPRQVRKYASRAMGEGRSPQTLLERIGRR